TPVARPSLPGAFERIATEGSEETQLTWVVRSCFVPSVKVPVAVYWSWDPLMMVAPLGKTSSVTSVAFVTSATVVPVIPNREAETVAVPGDSPRSRPFDPAVLETVAIRSSEELQTT